LGEAIAECTAEHARTTDHDGDLIVEAEKLLNKIGTC